MKSHLAKLSLALLSTVFLLGCQEQGSEPVGPEGPGPEFDKPGSVCAAHCHDDDAVDPGQSTLKLEFGMETTLLPVSVKESDTKLTVNNTDFHHEIIMNFRRQDGGDYDGPRDCTVHLGSTGSHDEDLIPADETFLLAQLKAVVDSGFFTMQIDKDGLDSPPSDGLLLVEHDVTFEGSTVSIIIMIQRPANVQQETPDIFRFTGPVVVRANGVGGGKGKKSRRQIACGFEAGDNMVMATINRSPA